MTAHAKLLAHPSFFREIRVLPFGAGAAREFDRLRSSKLRVCTMDLKIAAIALASRATLLTRNRIDFGRVPGLAVEDWSA